MAQIKEEKLTVLVSSLERSNSNTKSSVITEDKLQEIELVLQELIGENYIVEVIHNG